MDKTNAVKIKQPLVEMNDTSGYLKEATTKKRTPLPSSPQKPRTPLPSAPQKARTPLPSSPQKPRTPLPSAPQKPRTPLPSAPQRARTSLPSAAEKPRAPLSSAPVVTGRSRYRAHPYNTWQWRKNILRRQRIAMDIWEPTAAELRLKYRCKELSGLRWSQRYIEQE